MPASIHTIAFPSAASFRASAWSTPSARARRRGDRLVPVALAVVGRRGDDGRQLRPAFLRRADVDDLDPVRLALQLLPVAFQLLVVRQAIVVADVEPEEFLRRGDRLHHRRRRCLCAGHLQRDEEATPQQET